MIRYTYEQEEEEISMGILEVEVEGANTEVIISKMQITIVNIENLDSRANSVVRMIMIYDYKTVEWSIRIQQRFLAK